MRKTYIFIVAFLTLGLGQAIAQHGGHDGGRNNSRGSGRSESFRGNSGNTGNSHASRAQNNPYPQQFRQENRQAAPRQEFRAGQRNNFRAEGRNEFRNDGRREEFRSERFRGGFRGGRGSFFVSFGPPRPLYFGAIGYAPGPDYVWIDGYYTWDGYQYVWVDGYWAMAPYPRARWIPGYWGHHSNGFLWVGGFWR